MGRLTFDDLTPEDMPEPFYDDSGDIADSFRDSLGDLVRCGLQTTARNTMTLEQHLANNAAAIEAEVVDRAARFNLTLTEARLQVIEAYTEGWYEEMRDLGAGGGE